jgi:hypothetical protein
MDVKKGFYENWNLDKSATALINQALYNLQCDSFKIDEIKTLRSSCEVNYIANSNCRPKNYKAKLKGIRHNSHILFVCVYFLESDDNFEKIASRILESIENKYPYLENIKE